MADLAELAESFKARGLPAPLPMERPEDRGGVKPAEVLELCGRIFGAAAALDHEPGRCSAGFLLGVVYCERAAGPTWSDVARKLCVDRYGEKH